MRELGRRTTDHFYIPIHLVESYISIASVFFKYSVFTEIAGTTILNCIDNDDSPKQPFGVLNLWKNERNHTQKYFSIFQKYGESSNIYAFHPAKWSPLLSQNHENYNETLSFYCDTVIPWLHNNIS